jgi:predicted NBD/HSP70 family sugar kinase
MTRSTVSRLVDELIEGGVLTELDPATASGPGRPATPLVAGTEIAAMGLQVNATYLAARVIDMSGRVVAESFEYDDFVGPPPKSTFARLSLLAASVLPRVPESVRLVGVGLALPGIVSQVSGRLLLAPNLGWSDINPADLIDPTVLVGHDLRVSNEADLAARTVAEAAPGRPSGLSDFIYVSGEIGIGGAVVLDGRVMSGRHGWAGEIGHLCVDPAGPQCRCGSTGCLEGYAGRHAILTAAGLPLDTPPDQLATRAREGEAGVKAAIAEAARALGVALSGAINLLDMPSVVLGGHLGQIADMLIPDLETQLHNRVLFARWVSPSISAAAFDTAPGASGAAYQELSAVLDDPSAWLDSTPLA